MPIIRHTCGDVLENPRHRDVAGRLVEILGLN